MDSLPSSTKSERRSRSKPLQTSKPSLVMAFFSCVAWLYVAGRLWQDAENRTLLTSLLKKNSEQRPKVLTVEDKLMFLGCKDLERRIVEAEMDLTLAKSQGLSKEPVAAKRFFFRKKASCCYRAAVSRNICAFHLHILKIIVFADDALRKLEERGVVIRFVIGRSANRGDSLDRNIDEENRTTKDFLILENHEEAQEEFPKKAKYFFSTAVQMWDAEFYVKVEDNIDLDLEGLIGLLDRSRGQDGAYIGCMKSGAVVTEEGQQWYEPDWWKFGDGKSYFRHASTAVIVLSKNLAQYININSASLKTYAHDDTSVGSWMMGVQATYKDDNRLCCSSVNQGELPSLGVNIWFVFHLLISDRKRPYFRAVGFFSLIRVDLKQGVCLGLIKGAARLCLDKLVRLLAYN
ncbi:hypothetical protein Patl1_12502 [Pistacia atlantica]|uniref:Uncharacterized protein n=1 Tax=Pistacia atlantica TaxID=434234 RepID=A0ACC1ATI1_9ROSI|nr:hypothetical protein Patl1_12502 [Pistacia atlantica]